MQQPHRGHAIRTGNGCPAASGTWVFACSTGRVGSGRLEALGAARAAFSLNQRTGAEEESELGELLPDDEAVDPLAEAEEALRREGVRRALEDLPERERRILELRFGFHGDPWTLEAIGRELELNRERVRQLEAQALARMHETLAA